MHTNKLKTNPVHVLKNNCGMGIVQILAMSGIIMIIIYGLISLLMYSAQQQHKQTMLANLQELKLKMKELLTEQTSWDKTLHSGNNATSFDCIVRLAAAPCAAGAKIINEVLDASGATFGSQLPNDWNSPTNYPSGGFTARGIPCSGFNGTAGNGNNNCPFTYKIIWEPIVTVPATKDPAFRITARLLYNPADGSSRRAAIQLGSLTGLLGISSANIFKTPVISSSLPAASPNYVADDFTGKYDVVVWRTATRNTPGFRLRTSQSGDCKAVFNTNSAREGWIVEYDPFNLITLSNQGGRLQFKINFTYQGNYECDITGNGFNVDTFEVRLWNVTGGTDEGGSSSIARNSVQGTVQFNTAFHANALDVFEVRQRCQAGGGPSGLGVGVAVQASMTCKMLNGD